MPNFLDNLKDKAVDLAQTGVAMSKQVAEIAKLKTANLAEEDAIKKAYIEIGKVYYAEQGATPDGAYASLCEKITASKALIETNNERIAELKQSGDPEMAEDIVVEAEPAAEEPAEPAAVETAAEEVPAEEDKAE